ncbi:hypothetical protein PQX77_006718 [Marasmius sp. AFHP31]|nr:hypothetical protein PQX77_006718 [Marasmius sp. AFHP31]
MASNLNLRTKNVTYDDRDTNNLKYGPDWFQDGTWIASNVGKTGTLSGAETLDATVTFKFPMPAIAFYYFGMLRSKGGLYSICIDCNPNEPNFLDVDALNITDDGKNPPVALFSKRFDTPAQHVVFLRNQNDTRVVPEGNSQITIDRFVLEVVDDSLPVIPSPSPSLTSDTDKLGPPIGTIVGGAIGGFLLIIIMIATGVYYWHRRKHQLASVPHDNLSSDDSEASYPTIVPYPVMHPSISKGERSKAGELNPIPQRPPSPTPSSGSTTVVEYFRFRSREGQCQVDVERSPERRRREADAGPILSEDEESTLPPLYEQIFRVGPSNRQPPGQEPNGQSQPSASVMQNTAKQPM